jgi:hypothetical protein
MERGWIKLWRKSEDSRVFQNEGLWKVWTWCLMQAAHEGHWVPIKVGKVITEVWVEPGQFIFGRNSAAKRLRMAPSTVWKRMLKLENMRNSDINRNSNYSVVSIVNWNSYQPKKKKGDIKGDSGGTTGEHKQEGKEGKEGTNTSVPDDNGIPFEGIIDRYHTILSELPRVKVFTPKRKGMLKARWNEDKKRQSLEWWSGYFKYVCKSDFLMGRDARFKANLEWLINASNLVKVIEGIYN